MSNTHKILVNNETGLIIFPVHLIDDPRPEPEDCTFVTIQPGTALWDHFCINPPNDVSHIDLLKTTWDFANNKWNEVISAPPATLAMHVFRRNELLKQSDHDIADATDPAEIEAWTAHRQELRDMFVDPHKYLNISSKFTGYINGTTLTVVDMITGTMSRAMHILGPGVTDGTYIELQSAQDDQYTGTTGTGTYQITPSQTVGSDSGLVTLEGFNYASLAFPRSPEEISEIKRWAALGREDEVAIVKKEGL